MSKLARQITSKADLHYPGFASLTRECTSFIGEGHNLVEATDYAYGIVDGPEPKRIGSMVTLALMTAVELNNMRLPGVKYD